MVRADPERAAIAGRAVPDPAAAAAGPGPATAAPQPATAAAAAPAAQPWPSKLFVEVTSYCNLRCSMCVKQAPGQKLAEGSMTVAVFDRLAPAFAHLDALVLNGIGEPLLHPKLELYVARARELMPATGWIGFQTNGQLLTDRRARKLVDAGIDRIAFSADAVVDAQLMNIRDGAQIGPIELAATHLHQAADEAGRPITLGLEFVAMRENLDQLPGLIRWAARHRFGFVIVTHMLAYDAELADQAAFSPTTDRALEIYRQWRDVARADGVDLRRYLDLPYVQRHFNTFAQNLPLPNDQAADDARVAEYVGRMVQDAAEQGVSLKLKDVLSFDEAWLARVEDTFAQARGLAEAAGIELRLPAAVPTQVRQCHFVEEGSAFVSWNGDLHPCYFLWHGFQCHLGGLAKTVHPVTFGNVRSIPVLEAWNGPEWVRFRQNVLRYDFPFCYDCNLALCDYVDGGDFEQDCHVGSVPCATCLWCTGPFQCMR